MGQVVIRNIDDEVLERLKRRAAAQHKSLEQCLRDVLSEAPKPSREELIAYLERIRAMTPPRQPGVTYPTTEELIREDRAMRWPAWAMRGLRLNGFWQTSRMALRPCVWCNTVRPWSRPICWSRRLAMLAGG